ncbi:MAG: hypothetical protein J5379_02675 [Clostridiales bacterium]|nr:hypothetical protein [Clostridiales bacterium]
MKFSQHNKSLAVILAAMILLCSCQVKEETTKKKVKKIKKTSAVEETVEEPSEKPSEDPFDPEGTASDPSNHTIDTSAPTTNASARIDMVDIADTDWASRNYPYFRVSTPEQLAGTVAYLNKNGCGYDDGVFVEIEITCDLDLDAYEWQPLQDFAGNIYGKNHTIRNIHLNSPIEGHNGLIGCNGGLIGVFDLSIVDAQVKDGDYIGLFVAQGYMINLVNVFGSGTIESNGNYVGALVGRCSPSMTYEGCSMDVSINGEPAEFFSYTQENESHADEYAEEIYTLTLKDDYTIVRDDPSYEPWNLCWRIICNGTIVLERGADDELEYKYFGDMPGTYQAYLIEYDPSFGGYVRRSNIVEYTI